MSRKVALAAVIGAVLLAFGCEGVTPTSPETTLAPQGSGAFGAEARAVKVPISGNWLLTGEELPVRLWQTPSGVLQFRDWLSYTELTGDLEGPLDVLQSGAVHGSRQTARGPIEGQVTWQGRSGPVSGHWTTNGGENGDFDGIFMLHGSGDLEGVKFQLRWWGNVLQPALPIVLEYTGFALDPRGQ